jgi:chromosome segregation ATPase
MISGLEALGSIDEALQQVRRQMRELDQQIEAHSQQLARTGEEEVASYRRLASLRLDQLTSGEVISRLDETDRRVREILDLRARQLEDLQQHLLACHQQQSALEAQRQAVRREAAQVAERLDKAEAATQERLRHDAEHQRALERARRADGVAQQAEKKTEQAQQDLVEKGKPYESDRVFMYLWRRGYGTSRYAANPLTRFLDSWVARLVRYQTSRPNYSMLREIPERLREHAQRVRADADREIAALKALEDAAAAADGIPAIHDALAQVEKRIEQIDAAIKAEEERFSQLSKQQAAFGAG